MSVIKKESSATSAVLFLNAKGEPMRFFIRPGPTKVQLQPLISHGGGVLCRTQEPSAVLLADPGDIKTAVGGAGHFYISSQYVRDCVAQNQQLDIESYRLNNLQPIQMRAASRNRRGTGRMGYSLEDDTAILNFIAKHQKEAKGNRVWQEMERQGITSHSWQSMKDRFLKHLQHKLEQKSPESKKKVSPSKKSSSEDDSSWRTPKKKPKKKAVVVSSSDSDATQISCEHEGGTEEQPDLQLSLEEISSPNDPASEKRQMDEVRKEADGDESVSEEEQQHDHEQPEISPKRARMSTDTPATNTNTPATNMDTPATNTNTPATNMDTPATNTDTPVTNTSSGANDQSSSQSKKQNSGKPAASSGRKLGILERAAREFEDSQVIDGSQEDQASPIQASDSDEFQIMAARERAVREQVVNPEHPMDAEEPGPAAQTHRSTPETEYDDPGPSRAALPVTSNAHLFLFQQESQEELSQPAEEDQPSRSLLEIKQHVIRLMQESKKDLPEVMKALLKASGDVTLALSYLLDRYDPESHGPIWTRHDDAMLLSADSSECERLHEKYGADRVSKRGAFLKEDL